MGENRIASVDELARVIEGRSDEQINAALLGRYEETCRLVAGGMRDHFSPEKAKGASAVIQYDVKAPDAVHTFQLKVAGDRCEVVEGAPAQARVTLSLAFPDFLRLVAGKLDGMQAFFSGRLKLSGDMLFAQSMEGWFRPS